MSDEDTPTFDRNIHLLTYEPNDEQRNSIVELKLKLESECEIYKNSSHLQEWCNEKCLLRFLIARNYDISKSYEMITGAMKWRLDRKPQDIIVESNADWEKKMYLEAKTGKIYIAGEDKWKRPVIIFDNSVQNTTNTDGQLYFLAWNLETAIRIMPEKVDKYVVFMHLEHFSLFNSPNMKATKETIFMLCQSFPERLGHCVCFMPPVVFHYVYETIKFLVDKRTRNKIIFLIGDMSDNSPNDIKMKQILGNDWKILTGAMQPIVSKGCSPGYNFDKYWDNHMNRLKTSFASKDEKILINDNDGITRIDSGDETWRDVGVGDDSKENKKSSSLLYILLVLGLFFILYSLKVGNDMVSIICGLLGCFMFYGIMLLYPECLNPLVEVEKKHI
jgi:hypothetical protein